MPETYTYTWEAKDKDGQIVIKEIEAATAEDAKYILLARGYSDLVLKEDEISNIATASFRNNKKFLGEEIKITAEDRLKHRDDPIVTFWDVLRKGIGQSGFLLLLLIALAAYNIYRGHYVSAILSGGALVLWLVFLLCMGLPSIYYKKLIEAADWYRWKEVLSLVDSLKMIGRISFVKVPSTELTRYRAKAFVGMGDLQKGLAEYQQCEGRADCPGWLHKLFVAGLYTVAKQYDKAIEYNLASIAEKPGPVAWHDLAYRYARYKRDPVKARAALRESEKGQLPDIAKPSEARCRGVIAYLEGDYPSAKSELENSIHAVEKVKWRPFSDGHLAIARAYLCCVLAKQGDLSGAKKNFEMAKEYLIATKEDELIAECRQLIGVA
jgi:tetratricopeptide (TPR) repeat protein